MGYRIPKTIKISFENYSKESRVELDELSKLKLMVSTGYRTERKVYVSVDRPDCIEVRIYDLSNFSQNTYHDFNKKIRNLTK